MTFNDRVRQIAPGLSPDKKGRPMQNIKFEKNSSLFDTDLEDQNWKQKNENQWKANFKDKEA
jgi:hypothetical protein